MRQNDLTRGPVGKTMLLFSLPMILGNLLQQMYNIVDTWVVGRFVGADALAAVGASFSLMTFLTSILLGLSMGSGVVFSIRFGQKDGERLGQSIGAAFVLTAVIAALLTGLSLLCVDPILRWLNIPGEIWTVTKGYLRIVLWGIPAIFLYNFFGSYLKAMGNSAVPLLFLALSTAVNIALDLVFVAVFSWGASGAALATAIAQYLSGLGIGGYVLATSPDVRGALLRLRPTRKSLREIASYSILTCVQQSVMNLGILMVQGLVNSFGTAVMAAFAAATKIDAFAYMPAQEYGNAFSTFLAQNAGAQKPRRIISGIRYAFTTSIAYCVAVSAAMWFLAEQLMGIFIEAGNTEIIREGVRYLHIEGAFYCGIGCLFLLYGLYRALGKPGMSVVLTVISLGTRVALSYLLSAIPGIGVVGIWWSIPIGWALADCTGILCYMVKKKTLLRLE